MGRGKAAGDGTCRRLRTECGEDCDVRESSGGEEEGGTEAAQAGGMARAKLRNSPSESNSHVKTVPPARTEDVHGVSPLLPARRMGSLGSDVGQRYCRTAVVRGAAGGGSTFYLLHESGRISAPSGWRGEGSNPSDSHVKEPHQLQSCVMK